MAKRILHSGHGAGCARLTGRVRFFLSGNRNGMTRRGRRLSQARGRDRFSSRSG